MSSFEIQRLQRVAQAHSVAGGDATAVDGGAAKPAAARAGSAGAAAPGVSVEVRSEIDAARPPVDADRVAQIRAALKDGSYPIVPAKIADAMIAARLMMGIGK